MLVVRQGSEPNRFGQILRACFRRPSRPSCVCEPDPAERNFDTVRMIVSDREKFTRAVEVMRHVENPVVRRMGGQLTWLVEARARQRVIQCANAYGMGGFAGGRRLLQKQRLRSQSCDAATGTVYLRSGSPSRPYEPRTRDQATGAEPRDVRRARVLHADQDLVAQAQR